MQSCGQTTVEPALQEVTWGLQKGNELKTKKIYKQMFTDKQASPHLHSGKEQEGRVTCVEQGEK